MTSPTSPPTGSGFRLDVEKAEGAVAALRQVYEQLAGLQGEAYRVARIEQTAHDVVSREAFALLAEKAVGGPASFTGAVAGAMEHVDGLITQMEADIRQQQAAGVEAARTIERA